MKGKRTYGSPLPSPEKPAGKRRCLDIPTPRDSETDAHHDPPPDNVPESEASLQSAAKFNCPAQNDRPHDHSDPDTEQPLRTGTSQALALVEAPSVIEQEDSLVDPTSALVKKRAEGTLLSDWPAYSQGVTEGICDLKTLKRFMTSNNISDDHKAMWVSLVQTIVHEPDQKSMLFRLQNLLSGNSTLSDGLFDHLQVFRHNSITRQQWAVTGCILRYASGKLRWSAAHVLDLALWVGGPDAGVQAARALKMFGVWNPSSNFEPEFSITSIKTCLDPKTILRRIWPSESDGEELIISWANHHQASTDHPFANFKDDHSYLLRQCIEKDLTLFASMSRHAANLGDVSSRIISRAYFDSTLAPILVEHFDANVDLQLAYFAAVESQGTSIDRSPTKSASFFDVHKPQSFTSDNTKRHQDGGKNGKGKIRRQCSTLTTMKTMMSLTARSSRGNLVSSKHHAFLAPNKCHMFTKMSNELGPQKKSESV